MIDRCLMIECDGVEVYLRVPQRAEPFTMIDVSVPPNFKWDSALEKIVELVAAVIADERRNASSPSPPNA